MRRAAPLFVLFSGILILQGAAQLEVTRVDIGGIRQEISNSTKSRFINLNSDQNGNYPVTIQAENVGGQDVIVEKVDVRILKGSFSDESTIGQAPDVVDIDARDVRYDCILEMLSSPFV